MHPMSIKATIAAACVSIATIATFVTASLAAPSAGQKCKAAKLKAAGKEVGGKMTCHAAAKKEAAAVDSVCLSKHENKSDTAISKAGSACSGTPADVHAAVDECVTNFLLVDPGDGACPSASAKTIAKGSKAELTCQAKDVLKTGTLADCETTAHGTITKGLEKAGGCTHAPTALTYIDDCRSYLHVIVETPTCTEPFAPVIDDVLDVFALRWGEPGSFEIPASCGGSLEVCCTNGTPVSPCGPIEAEIVAASASLAATSDPDRFTFSVPAVMMSVADIPVSGFGLDCVMTIDTSPGASPTVQITGEVGFSADRLRMTDVTALDLLGLEDEDFSIGEPGGGFGFCDGVAWGDGFVADTLRDALTNVAMFTDVCRACGSSSVTQCAP